MAEINEKEKHAIECFKRYHKCNYFRLEAGHIDIEKYKQILDLVFLVSKEGTGVGEKVTVMCTACGEIFDVTNYDTW